MYRWAAVSFMFLYSFGIPGVCLYLVVKNRETLIVEEHTSSISFAQFKAMHARQISDGTVTTARLHTLFNLIDSDNSGTVSAHEFADYAALEDAFVNLTGAEAAHERKHHERQLYHHLSTKTFSRLPQVTESTENERLAELQQYPWWKRSKAELNFLVKDYE
jgi:Ca2+-binding EF-hand superfamily protein